MVAPTIIHHNALVISTHSGSIPLIFPQWRRRRRRRSAADERLSPPPHHGSHIIRHRLWRKECTDYCLLASLFVMTPREVVPVFNSESCEPENYNARYSWVETGSFADTRILCEFTYPLHVLLFRYINKWGMKLIHDVLYNRTENTSQSSSTSLL